MCALSMTSSFLISTLGTDARWACARAATTLVASPAFAANTLTDLEGDDRGDNHRQRDRRQGPDCVAHHAPAILASFIDKVAQVHLVNAVELLDRLTEQDGQLY